MPTVKTSEGLPSVRSLKSEQPETPVFSVPKRKKFIGFQKKEIAIFVAHPPPISRQINSQSGVYTGEGKINTEATNSPKFQEVIVHDKSQENSKYSDEFV
jgi:hypothetical protein